MRDFRYFRTAKLTSQHFMKRFFILATSLFCAAIMSAQSVQSLENKSFAPLEGFVYAKRPTAPTGDEWQSPQALALNKEQPHAWGFHFPTENAARGVLPERGAYWLSLDGTWKFHWCKTPEERAKGFEAPSYDVTAWDNITVPGCWNIQGIQKDGSLLAEIWCSHLREPASHLRTSAGGRRLAWRRDAQAP